MSTTSLRSRWLLLLICLLVSGCGFCGTSDIEDGTTEFVTTVSQGFVSSYVLDVGGGEVVLIDTGGDEEAPELEAELEARGLSHGDIAAILITHGHGDHVGGLAAFDGVPVYAHRGDFELIEEESGVRVERQLEHEQELTLGERTFVIHHMPGHTAGSVAILVDGMLFFGDNAVATSKGELRLAPKIFGDDPDQNVESLVELAAWIEDRQVDVMFFSHSGSLQGTQALEDFAAAQ